MTKTEETYLYRVIAQKEDIMITAETGVEMTQAEAGRTVVAELLGGAHKAAAFNTYVALPIATKKRWEERCINFCPRCGGNLKDQELGQSETFDCHDCNLTIDVQIHAFNEEGS